MFGSRLVPLGPGEFGGNHCKISLPVGAQPPSQPFLKTQTPASATFSTLWHCV